MLWLTWHMWILLLLAFAGGVITGWIGRGGRNGRFLAHIGGRTSLVGHWAFTR